MKLIADLHTHTVASSHAYSTILEMVQQAQKLGLAALAVTEHGPAMPDGPHPWYFANLVRMPDIVPDNFLLLKGIEVNVLDKDGTLDLLDDALEPLDWVIASIHRYFVPELSEEEATTLWLRIAENPLVDMIGHSEQRQHAYDYDKVTKAFTQNNKVVEINSNSTGVRPGNEENLRELILACKKNHTKLSVNSDAHSVYDLGNQGSMLNLLQELEYPEELVVNASMPRLLEELQLHNKPIAGRIKNFTLYK